MSYRAPGRDAGPSEAAPIVESAHPSLGAPAASAALMESVARLRAHLALDPDDLTARLRLGQLLIRLDERRSARAVLESLVRESGEAPVAHDVWTDANRMLAVLDEREGALGSAELRWERVLADDIDDTEAWEHLARLRPRHPTAPTMELPLTTLAGPAETTMTRHRLVRELGRGATATVYLVRDERLDLPLALKVLHPQFASPARTSARLRFFAEARLAARVRHPGVVAIYDVDEATRSLLMEYLPGGTLRDRIRRDRAPSPSETLDIACSLLDTLAFVHANGVIHGDLKPGNILFRARNQIVLADFGAAEIAPPPSDVLGSPPHPSAPREFAGTPLYLAPEQLHGAKPSIGSDLFALGTVLWELVAGRPARRHGDLLVGADTALPPVPHRPTWADADGAATHTRLARVIAALTAVRPEHRPASADEARRELLGAGTATTALPLREP